MIEIKNGRTSEVIHRVDADTLRGANLSSLNLNYANLFQADLSGANLSGAHLVHAHMPGVDLSGADLSGASMHCVDLSAAKLPLVDLTKTWLNQAKLTRADLSGANLIGARLNEADLRGANLFNANLNSAELGNANLSSATLVYTDLTGTLLYDTLFANCLTLHFARGLDVAWHKGPSILNRETLAASVEHLPDVFLLGVGYTEEEIIALRDLYGTAKPIQFYSCFISYSHKDEDFAQRLHGRMRQAGLRVWYAPEEMKGGEKLHEQIDRAIQVHDRLLLVLSENSLGSEWVATEIRKARKAERKEGRKKLFPIRLVGFDPLIKEWECFDADSGKDLGVEIREYFIPDFAEWKEQDPFEASFARLLRDMQAAEQAG